MKRILKKNLFLSLGMVIGCSSIIFLSVESNKTSSVEASSYTAGSIPKNLNLNDTSANDIRNYYSSLNSLSTSERQGTNLLKNLKPILKNGQIYHSYGSSATTAVWQAYEIVDRDWVKSPASQISGYNASTGMVTNYQYGSSNSSVGSNPYVHALYINRNVDNQTRAWGNHNQDGWGINQEHTWPKSLGFDNDNQGTGARGDLMHLWAGNGRVNGDTHSNYFYGYVDTSRSYNDAGSYASQLSGNRRGYSRSLGGNTTVFEPQDTDKGDIARAMFYMAARYNYLSGSDSDGIDAGNPNLEIINSLSHNSSFTSSTTVKGQIGVLQDLLEWNRLDPPDEWEIHRNNLCYNNFTNNRNPFIDFPEWAEFIWGKCVDGSYNSSSTGYAIPNNDKINKFGNGGVSPNPSVESVTVSPNSLKLDLNGTKTGNLTVNVEISNGASQNVTWSSLNSTVATVSSTGVVTAVAVGTCTIRATSSADSTKYGDCTVTVIDSSQGGTTGNKYTLGWGTVAGDEGTYTNFTGTQGTVDDLFSFTTNKNSSGTAPAYNSNASELRLYYDSSGNGGSVTIVPEDGITITDAVIKASTNPTLGYSVDGGSRVTVSKENNQYTITGISASSSLTLQNVNTTNTQLRITSIELTYDIAGVIPEKNLSSISLDLTNVDQEFFVDDPFSFEGLVVTANYDDNSSSIVGPTSVSTPDMTTAGNKTITVTYTEKGVTKTATYEITLSAHSDDEIFASVDGVFHPGDYIQNYQITVTDKDGNEIDNDFIEFDNDGYQFTYNDAPSGGGIANKTFENAVTYNNISCNLIVPVSRNAYAVSYIDKLNRVTTGISGTTYTTWSGKILSSGVTYAGQSAGANDSIQLRSNNSNSGVISTANPNNLDVLSITLTWNSNTDSGRNVRVYGDTKPFTAPTNLYGNTYQGTYLGNISCENNATFVISGSYQYIGLRSDSGALYLEEIAIKYGSNDSAENFSNYIMFEDTDGQCEEKFEIAKEYFGNLSSADRRDFMESDEYVILTARERFVAWAAHWGKTIYYVNNDYEVRPSLVRKAAFEELTNNDSIIILVAMCSICVGGFSIFYLIKKRRLIHTDTNE